MWIWLGLLSALLLGAYDVAKKWSLRDNDVLMVLFAACLCGAALTGFVSLFSFVVPQTMAAAGLRVEFPGATEHAAVALKSLLIAVSWICAYYALKHLPISIVAPIRSSSPAWTLVGAVVIFGERMSNLQWCGIAVTFGCYYAFSLLGRAEGIRFARSRPMLLLFIALITGAVSGLYDKHLLQRMMIAPATLQAWFSFYLAAIVGLALLVQRGLFPSKDRFQWRSSIVLVGVLLILSDFAYFRALSSPDALISVLSTVRRSSVVVAFFVGGILFAEKNKRKKMIPLFGLLGGIVLLLWKT